MYYINFGWLWRDQENDLVHHKGLLVVVVRVDWGVVSLYSNFAHPNFMANILTHLRTSGPFRFYIIIIMVLSHFIFFIYYQVRRYRQHKTLVYWHVLK